MGKTKTKPKVWCTCAEPRPLLSSTTGEPFTVEPICRKPEGCGHAIKRRLPGPRRSAGPPVFAIEPWAGPGPCPPPPETETEAYARGAALATQGESPAYVAPAPTSPPPRPQRDPSAALARLRALRALQP